MEDEERSEESQERQRPRVVDKRVSSRSDTPAKERAASPPPQPVEPVAPVSPPLEPDPPAAPFEQDAGGPEVWTPEQEEAARQIMEDFAMRPALEWVANASVTLANVAGAKLDAGDPAGAQLAIDALAGMVESLGPRLGDLEPPLRQTLAQLQMEYVRVTTGGPPA